MAAASAAAELQKTTQEHLYKVLVIGEFGVGEYFMSYSLHLFLRTLSGDYVNLGSFPPPPSRDGPLVLELSTTACVVNS